jgi:hypothetical protein
MRMFGIENKLDGNARQAFLVAVTNKLHELKAGTPEWIALGSLLRRWREGTASITEQSIAADIESLAGDARLNPEAIASVSATIKDVYARFAGHLQFLFKGHNVTVEEITPSKEIAEA